MINIINHQGNDNLNKMRYQNTFMIMATILSVEEKVVQLECSYTAGGSANWYNPFRKVMKLLKWLNLHLAYES